MQPLLRYTLGNVADVAFQHHNLNFIVKRVIENKENSTLSELQCSVLKLNSNFAISKPPSFPHLIAPIEKAFKNSRLSDTQKENLRHLILANVNFNSTNIKSNLT